MSNELDKQIGKKLGQYESEVDVDALWQTVRPPRRRRPWLLLLLLFGIVALAGGLWWTLGDVTTTGIDQPVATILNEQQSESSMDTGTIADENVENHTVQEQGIAENSFSSKTVNDEQQQGADLPPTFSVQEKSSVAAGNTEITSSNIAGNQQGDPNLIIDELADNTLKNELVEGAMLEENLIAEEHVSDLTQEAESSPQTLNILKEDYIVSVLPTLTASYLSIEQPVLLPSVPTPSVRRRKNDGLFTQIDVAYLAVQRTLEAADSSFSSDWSGRRIGSEKVLEGISADLSIGYRHRNGWQLRGGLGYTKINTVFSQTVTIQTVDTLEGLQTIIFNPDNTTDSVFGPVPFYETSTREKQTYNSFRQWELPLLAGYNFDLGALDLLVETGVRLQLNRTWEGTILNGETENTFQELSEQDWYRSGLNISLQGGVQLVYPLTPKVDILAGGSIRYSLQDFSNDTSPFKERYQLLGGQVSLRYKF